MCHDTNMRVFDPWYTYFNSSLMLNFPFEKQHFHSFSPYFEGFINTGELPNNAGQQLEQSSKRVSSFIMSSVPFMLFK